MLLTMFCMAFIALLIFIALTDVNTRRIPNAAVVALLAVALLIQALNTLGSDAHVALPGIVQSLICAAIVLVLGVLFEMLWRKFKGGAHGLGMGDIKLSAASALVLGWYDFPCIALACIVAAVVESLRGNKTFAFGPYLCATFSICFLYLAFLA
jgi:prepilin signal peptidase PulO-like enzyme (type II secretory pathway)